MTRTSASKQMVTVCWNSESAKSSSTMALLCKTIERESLSIFASPSSNWPGQKVLSQDVVSKFELVVAEGFNVDRHVVKVCVGRFNIRSSRYIGVNIRSSVSPDEQKTWYLFLHNQKTLKPSLLFRQAVVLGKSLHEKVVSGLIRRRKLLRCIQVVLFSDRNCR